METGERAERTENESHDAELARNAGIVCSGSFCAVCRFLRKSTRAKRGLPVV